MHFSGVHNILAGTAMEKLHFITDRGRLFHGCAFGSSLAGLEKGDPTHTRHAQVVH